MPECYVHLTLGVHIHVIRNHLINPLIKEPAPPRVFRCVQTIGCRVYLCSRRRWSAFYKSHTERDAAAALSPRVMCSLGMCSARSQFRAGDNFFVNIMRQLGATFNTPSGDEISYCAYYENVSPPWCALRERVKHEYSTSMGEDARTRYIHG
jgi:hypothetical protein